MSSTTQLCKMVSPRNQAIMDFFNLLLAKYVGVTIKNSVQWKLDEFKFTFTELINSLVVPVSVKLQHMVSWPNTLSAFTMIYAA